jgi:type III restriction enzyme
MSAAGPASAVSDPYAIPERRKPSDNTYAVNGVRARVDAWRAQGYRDASATSRRLLGFWFADEHRREDGQPFRFYFCQREAVETFIYLTEIEPVRELRDLLEFAEHSMLLQPGETKRQRLAMKLATGSGKTMAMSLSIVWSYFHALYEEDSPLTTSFLVIAPNLIVFERLKSDFGDGATFRRDPLVPPEWAHDFDLAVLLQDDPAPVTARGVLYLTNVQRLYEPPATGRDKAKRAPNPVEAMVGPRVNRDMDASSAERLFEGIAERGRVMVVNDEAHHVHDDKLKWNQTIERLHEELRRRSPADAGAGVVSQLDFSATPKYEDGGIFRHVVVDYPLAQAVADGIVKTPVIGEVKGAEVELGDTTAERNRQWLDVAVSRWRAFHEDLSPSGHRPVLFVMCENTDAADWAGDYLRQLPDLADDRTLVIHINQKTGDIAKADLDMARRAAREADRPDSRIRCIVSVLMLREGWDVRNVCVIVTLRPLSAANRILPEQALGRGLRRMTTPGSGFDERVVVIEHEAFRDLWRAELDGGLVVERKDADKIVPGAVTIFADEAKRRYDIVIPQLTRVLARSENALGDLRPSDVADPSRRLAVPDVEPDEYVHYRGRHLIDKGIIEEYEFRVPYAEDPSGVITYYTRRVARTGGVDGLSGAFAALAPMVRDYLKERVFERPVELEDKVILRRLAENDAQALVVGAFGEAIRALSIAEREPTITENALRISETPPFPWSRRTMEGGRTVFNLTPVENALEARFAQFLDRASDVAAWAKLATNNRFVLEYISREGALRYYHPDFVVRLTDDSCLIVETKGREDVGVALKDRRARRWCEDATRLAGRTWTYLKVGQARFDAYTGGDLDGLRRFVVADEDSSRAARE